MSLKMTGDGLRFRNDMDRGLNTGASNAVMLDAAIRTRRCVHMERIVTSTVDSTKTTCVRMLRRSGAMNGILKASDQRLGGEGSAQGVEGMYIRDLRSRKTICEDCRSIARRGFECGRNYYT